MTESEVQIVNDLGLHARAAARFVHLANTFSSRIWVSRDVTRVDGKSILGLLTLAATKGSRLKVTAEGDDEEQAVRQLVELAGNGFGEGK